MVDQFARCPAPMGQILIEHFHGAVTRVGATDTAFPHRMAGYNLLVLGQWLEARDNEACIGWSRAAYDAMRPFMGMGRYVNYLGDDEQSEATAEAYGPNYRRLQQLKKKYDPDNVFRLNQNIQPLA
jgi:FAD/FMN-containing dehydrogenase